MTAELFRLVPAALGFKDFYDDWPNKVARKAGERAWDKAIRIASPETIIAGRDRYIRNKPDYQAWMHPATFLNGERWTDKWEDESAPRYEPRGLDS